MMMFLSEELEQHPVFPRMLALILEQLLELGEGRLVDAVVIHQKGGDWAAASQYYEMEGL